METGCFHVQQTKHQRLTFFFFTSATFRNTLKLSSCTEIQVCTQVEGIFRECMPFLVSLISPGWCPYWVEGTVVYLSSDKPVKPVSVNVIRHSAHLPPGKKVPWWIPAAASLCAVCMVSHYLSGFPPLHTDWFPPTDPNQRPSWGSWLTATVGCHTSISVLNPE